jgi:hypothetical protein
MAGIAHSLCHNSARQCLTRMTHPFWFQAAPVRLAQKPVQSCVGRSVQGRAAAPRNDSVLHSEQGTSIASCLNRTHCGTMVQV